MSQHDQHPGVPAQAFATRVIHAGQAPGPSTGVIIPPIYVNSTCIRGSPRVRKGLDFGRSHNPTRWAPGRYVVDLESGTQVLVFVFGLAVISSVLELLDTGPHIVFGNDLYGGTFRLFKWVRRHSAGYRFSSVDPTDLQAFEAALTPETRMAWVGTSSSSLLRLTDLCTITQLYHTRDIISVADNTFVSPYVQRPLELGFDVVMYSTTEYLDGHPDVIGGVTIVGDSPDLCERPGFLQSLVGAISGPFDTFLIPRGVKTPALRMEHHCSDTLTLAQWLRRQPQVARAYYPGLTSHPQHELAKRQIRGFGGMISLDLRCDLAGARRLLENVRIFSLAESLGGVESLIKYLAIATHASIPTRTRAGLGIGDLLIRPSMDVEALEGLQADLTQTPAKI